MEKKVLFIVFFVYAQMKCPYFIMTLAVCLYEYVIAQEKNAVCKVDTNIFDDA